MGILDSALKGILGGNSGQGGAAGAMLTQVLGSLGSANSPQNKNALASVMGLVQKQGGLPQVLDLFHKNGLSKEANSWVSTGANLPISSAQIEKVFGANTMQNVASQIGSSQNEVSSIFSKLLPEFINQLTPKGNVPNNHAQLLTQGLAFLKQVSK